ncbi:MAG TPA: 23S rRNA (uracil(1939)-C(5))-methyltransferase RlmD [Gammaproteobacteria bacterium]|nr:23S rRNA (uracil(1939)-C(5))-methyltransferase RlmD [Gammaproteobacteria bacterium]
MNELQDQRLPPRTAEASVTALSHDGRGIARVGGKALFIEDALPGEQVSYRILRRRRDYDEARAVEVVAASESRVTPRCAHFGVCGGCALQHLEPAAQIAAKQQTLLDNLKRIGGVEPQEVLPPLTGPVWGYRRRARLSARHVGGKGRLLLGFTERHRPFVTDTRRCEVLDPKVGGSIEALAELLGSLSIADRIPQVELAIGDADVVLVLRVLAEPSMPDVERLKSFEQKHGCRFYLQPGAPGTAAPLTGEPVDLHYRLPEWDVDIRFTVTDFIQVNGEINRQLVSLALAELGVQPGESVLDLFCGLGNFTLPLARLTDRVTGVEGDAELVARARLNGRCNDLEQVAFHQSDLYALDQDAPWLMQCYDRILLDPPRAGAREVIARFPPLGAKRVVYVSCHPGTLARDAKTLVEEQGYRLQKCGVLDMFPHTSHVESLAVFTREGA